MDPISILLNVFIGTFTGGLVVLADNHDKRRQELSRKELRPQLGRITSLKSLKSHVESASQRVASQESSTLSKEAISLLQSERFHSLFAEWIASGGIPEGSSTRAELYTEVVGHLAPHIHLGAEDAILNEIVLDHLHQELFEDGEFGRWQHQRSLDYLRSQITELRTAVDESIGLYSAQRQRTAVDSYREQALRSWDIIDLNRLPRPDVENSVSQILLRQLYMPLRVEVERHGHLVGDAGDLVTLEERRAASRLKDAGLAGESISQLLTSRVRYSLGHRLSESKKIVVLGDPGAGKTTLMRWMATAFLLKEIDRAAFERLPDVSDLPDFSVLPIMIRCRDLGQDDLCRAFVDVLRSHLNKLEIDPDDARVMHSVLLKRLADGEALLLVDGLDEISSPKIRSLFCQELERTSVRFGKSCFVVTSRVVGYRDMPYRLSTGFEHTVIADLGRHDKENFAARWIAVTESKRTADERRTSTRELVEALHSNSRVESLTGNPLLLTTLALVKRKVGRLPDKRSRLYREAVTVLLDFNPTYDELREDEALPQLEYIAYEMCRRGTQSLAEDELVSLLEGMRGEYQNLYAIKRRSPEDFLRLLEARSSLLIQSGNVFSSDQSQQPVWEFRHLTFQEYLASRAILDGKFPNRTKSLPLSQQVAPLAEKVDYRSGEPQVAESWREALRLLVTEAPDDDIPEILLALLNGGHRKVPLEGHAVY